MPDGAIRALIHPTDRNRGRLKARRAVALAALSVAATGWISSRAMATTDTWVGNDDSNTNWSDSLNWNPVATPSSGDTLVFGNPGTSGSTLNDDLTTFTAAGITFLNTNSQYNFTTQNSATLTLAGNINDASPTNQTITVPTALASSITVNTSSSTSDLIFSGPVSGKVTLTKIGAGALTFNNQNTFNGTLDIGSDAATSGANPQIPIGGGSVLLNFQTGATTSNILSPSTTVSLGGSSFDVIGSSTASTSQQLTGVTVQAGFSTIQVSSLGQNTVLNIGALSVVNSNLDKAAAQLNFQLPTGTQSTTNGITTSNTNTSGILLSTAGLAAFTVNSTDWATNSNNLAGRNIIGLSQSSLNHYTAYTGQTGVSTTANLDIQKDGTISTVGQETCQTIRFNTPATTGLTGTLTVGAAQTFSVGAGGILITPNVGTTNVAIGAGDSTSILRGALNLGLSIFQYDTQNVFSINPIIADNGATPNAVTIGGGGTVQLNGINTYTNSTTVSGGSAVEISANANLGSPTANAALTLNKGTLAASASFSLGTGANNRALGLGTYGGTIDVIGTNTLTIPGVISDSPASPGSLTKTDTGTLLLSNANTYGGGTNLKAGTLVAANTSGSATGTGNITLNGGILANTGGGSIAGNVIAGTASHTIAPGGIGSIGSFTLPGLTTNNFTTLNFDLGTGSGIVTNGDLLTLGAGTITIGAGTQLSFGGSSSTSTDYRLIGGSIGGINLANFSLPTAPIGQSYSLSNSVDPGFIDLVIGSVPNLTWNNAAATGAWNTTDANWSNGNGNSNYSDGSLVTFDDNNNGNYSVTLNSTVAPASITINNSGGSYVISGTGSIGGATGITKTGTGTATIGTVNGYAGVTTVQNGTLVENVNRALPTYSTVQITGGTLQLGASIGLQNMLSLAISGNGTLDINNNHIIMPDGGPGSNFVSSVAAWIASGYNGGLWNGPGIDSSAAALDPTHYGIGFADGSDPGNPAGLSSGVIEIAYTLLGDADLNHIVNGIDFGIVAANFNKGVTSWDQGDFDYNDIVNGVDFGDLAVNFNKGASSAADIAALDAFAAANGLLADVPEPATLGLFALGGVGLLARRRRQ